MRRFLAVLTHPGTVPAIAQTALHYGKGAGLAPISQMPGLLLMAQNMEAFAIDTEAFSGGIIGDLYFRHGPGEAFDGTATAIERLAPICRSAELAERCWGSFLLLGRPDMGSEFAAYHAPFSSLPVYYACAGDALVLASDAHLLAGCTQVRARISWPNIASQLAFDDFAARTTCLTGICELRGGETLEWPLNAALITRFNWNPWHHASQDRWLDEEEAAKVLLEREIMRCTSARISRLTLPLLDLSGGLDSSLLAAMAARRKTEVRAVTVFSAATEGDERGFARAVAEHLGIKLAEAEPQAERVDVRLCPTPYLPRPHARSFVQEIDRLTLGAAPDATAFINGGGGDAVLCHLQSSGPAVDRWRSQHRLGGFLHTVTELSAAAQVSFWVGLRKAVAKSMRTHAQVPLAKNPTFLSADVRCVLADTELPWPPPPPDLCPGKLEHVRGIYSSCFNMHGFARSGSLKAVYPMLSQPLIEICLRIPTWMWLGNGHNRYLARRVAAKWLPPQVAWRRSKGGLGRLQRDVYRLNKERLREMLLDGALQAAGLVDRRAIEGQLAPGADLTSHQFPRLLRLADFEAWAQHWA
ncbi:asparagine synthase (glutamine-hydrolyzing) [Novosphingobium fluoreni]|uniref:asparagine synthase (glutamine-hydrolyzing) n=1 Tax=Novosphingobium fluoreni TaxID=1391222 RepID=A0A7W6G105_9SPHN|nr:asparagine synthetase B family protein [Novosphingobium fluoreni]MBB3941747.1 asparagine synthase (glutamine-hydrolyzing) [Novosphingobium fluoreni]